MSNETTTVTYEYKVEGGSPSRGALVAKWRSDARAEGWVFDLEVEPTITVHAVDGSLWSVSGEAWKDR